MANVYAALLVRIRPEVSNPIFHLELKKTI